MRWRQPTQSIPLGTYGSALFRRWLRLDGQDTKSHLHVMGKSGSGKSRWLAGFYVNLLKAGFSATLIDPHGDLARLVLAQLVADGYFEQDDAYRRLLYLDIPKAAKAGRYLNFNCLEQPYDAHTTTRLTLEALRRAFPELDRNAGNAAPAFEQIVTAGTHVLVENGLPFSELRRVLLEKSYREQLLQHVTDPLIADYFHTEFDAYDKGERLHLVGSTLRRLFLLLYAPVVRFALSAPKNDLEYRAILQANRSLIVNLAIQDPDAKRLLGCLLTVFAEQGAKSRADLAAAGRTGAHYVIVDECQLFVSNSSAALNEMLSQTRKFGMFVVLSHQTRDQIPERMWGALQNVEVDITFRTGREDAERQAKVVGSVDPDAIKHEVKEGQERSHPAFYSLPEQWEGWTQQVTGLKKRFAFVKHPSGQTVKIQSLPLPDPVVDPARLARIEEHYLASCFRAVSLTSPAPAVIFDGTVLPPARRRRWDTEA
jgi:hypothetical protein